MNSILAALFDSPWAGGITLLIDVLLIAFISSAIVAALQPEGANARVRIILRYLAASTIIFASALILSAGGLLSASGFLVLHALMAVFALILTSQGKSLRLKNRANADIQRQMPARAELEPLTRVLIALLLVGGVLIFLQAILAEPLNYDSNTYRLTRVGYWLQEGRLGPIASDDPRHTYMQFLPDVLMLWVTCFFAKGYPMVNTIQAFSGLILSVTMWEFARSLGFRSLTCAALVAFMLGIPNLGLQLFTSQTDLVATAFVFPGIFLIWTAVQTRQSRYWLWSGVAFGLAISAKGTVLYWGPGLLFLLIVWLARSRYPLMSAVRDSAMFMIPLLILSSPPYLQNLAAYGNPLAPPMHTAKVHAPPPSGRLDYTAKNLTCYTWQLFEPNSNPLIPDGLTAKPFEVLAESIARWDEPPWFNFDAVYAVARRSYAEPYPNEDVASMGVLPIGLALIGLFLILLRRHKVSQVRYMDIAWIAISGVLFFLLIACLQAWTPHKYRYLVLTAPLVALAAASLLERIRNERWYTLATCMLFAAGLTSLTLLSLTSYHHGWLSIVNPQRTPHANRTTAMRSLVNSLPPGPLHLGLVLRENTWIAPFFRTRDDVSISFVPTGAFAQQPLGTVIESDTHHGFLTNSDQRSLFPPTWSEIHRGPISAIGRPGKMILPMEVQPVSGFFGDGWTTTRFSFRLENVPENWDMNLTATNGSPFEQTIVVFLDGREILTTQAAPRKQVSLQAIVPGGTHLLELEVEPPFIPIEVDEGLDRRELGLKNPRIPGAMNPTED